MREDLELDRYIVSFILKRLENKGERAKVVKYFSSTKFAKHLQWVLSSTLKNMGEHKASTNFDGEEVDGITYVRGKQFSVGGDDPEHRFIREEVPLPFKVHSHPADPIDRGPAISIPGGTDLENHDPYRIDAIISAQSPESQTHLIFYTHPFQNLEHLRDTYLAEHLTLGREHDHGEIKKFLKGYGIAAHGISLRARDLLNPGWHLPEEDTEAIVDNYEQKLNEYKRIITARLKAL